MTYQHQSQYQPGADLITRRAGCTWTTGANGVAATTSGAHRPTPDEIHELLNRNEESSPTTPGWNLTDLSRALGRYGMAFQDHTDEGWSAVVEAHGNRHYIALQGVSAEFNGSTCSGAFDGTHCIGIDPTRTKFEGGVTYWWIDDPICPTGRWERVAVLKAYATKLWTRIRFGYFLQPVPRAGWHADIPAGTRFVTFEVKGELIVPGSAKTVKTAGGVHVPCTMPQVCHFASGRKRTLVRLGGDGPNAGKWVNAKWAHQ